ncbi:sigma-70 family RNA polymerase sigma factor [Salinibacterium sp.]|uniref:sigma-70 family RNA polymerase sigma factor n=1 Tax=Salinibacterium sp. TaxID=1915057 RepID=UPI00286D5179|nr:sigma-70 family RNA polymerase sigma factor [Salinibacterium sp.]
MRRIDDSRLTVSDETLVEQTRSGDQRAFAELWRRHVRSGARVARQFTSSIDADDLVAEAYTRIYRRVLAGGGPTGAFRPYLYTTIRNLASTWGAASHDVQVDEIADFEDPTTIDDPVALALDRTLTARAFRSLPERWQTVLWYTEVEGMDPHEVAPILAMTANGVAALSYRAREGLRRAWLQAHITDASSAGECRWTISHIGEHARHGLTTRDTERLGFHLTTCAKCAIINDEVDEVGSRLALVMLPILLGGVAGGTMLASYASAGSAAAASVAIPTVPLGIGSGAATASALGFFGIAGAPLAIVGVVALAVAVSGAVVTTGTTPDDTVTSVSQGEAPSTPGSQTAAPTADHPVGPDDPTNLGVAGVVVPGATPGVADSLVGAAGDSLSGDLGGVLGGAASGVVEAVGTVVAATISLDLSGTATAGATVSLQAAGQVYATTTVDRDGNWAITVAGVPAGLASLDLVQQVDRAYLKGLLPGGGVLATVLGTVDGLVDALIRPLRLSGGGSGVAINLRG